MIELRHRRARRCAAAVTALVFVAALAPGATAQGPTIAPIVLAVPGSTRALALGNSYAALGADPDVIFYNPAQLVPARGIGVGLQRFERSTFALSLSAASVLAPGTLAIGVQLLDHAVAEQTFEPGTLRGERALFDRGDILATGIVASLAYARPAFFSTRVGVTGKLIHQQHGMERDATAAVDVGVSGGSSIQVALVGRNLGHGIRPYGPTVALPREVMLAAGVPRREVGPLDLAATASISMFPDGSIAGGGGTEWAYMPLDGFTFAARVGYRAVEGTESHVTLGGGFIGERFSLDYAFQASDDAGGSHRVGVRWR